MAFAIAVSTMSWTSGSDICTLVTSTLLKLLASASLLLFPRFSVLESVLEAVLKDNFYLLYATFLFICCFFQASDFIFFLANHFVCLWGAIIYILVYLPDLLLFGTWRCHHTYFLPTPGEVMVDPLLIYSQSAGTSPHSFLEPFAPRKPAVSFLLERSFLRSVANATITASLATDSPSHS